MKSAKEMMVAVSVIGLVMMGLLVGCAESAKSTTDESLAAECPTDAQPGCDVKSLPQLPDVTITSVTQETQPVPHCKVAGVIGPEIHFEL
ncbi:MAG: hypothetical protein ACYTEQ_20485, partial [Planctomycetota bacterium]